MRTERGNTIMAENGYAFMTTTENVTADFTESGTTAYFTENDTTTDFSENGTVFTEIDTTALPTSGIGTSLTTGFTEDGTSSRYSGSPTKAFIKSDSSTVEGRRITSATQWRTSGTTTWSSGESFSSLSGSSPFSVGSTSDVPSAFHSLDQVTGWFRSSGYVTSSSSLFNDTTAWNDTDDWGYYASPAWGPGPPWFVSTLDGYPYPSLYGWAHIVVASIVVTAIMLLIVLGNVLVIVAVARDRNLSGIQNWFITSLALSDLFVGLFIMPLSLSYELMGYWTFGNVLCELWLATDVLLCTASILNLVLISLDRYWSITRAVSYVRQRTRRRAVLMIGAVWVMSMIISLPPLVGWKRPQPTKFGYPQCVLSEEPGYVIYSTMGSFYLPLVVMVMVYLKIYLAARHRARKNLKKRAPGEGNHCKSTRSGTTTTTTSNTTSTPITDPLGKYKGAVDKLCPTREVSSGSPSPPPPFRSTVVREEPKDVMEAEVAQVTIESISPSTPSPVGGNPSTVLTFSADPSPVGPPTDAACSVLLSASTVVYPHDVSSSVVHPHDVASSVVHTHDESSSVVSSSVALSSPVHSSVVNSSVLQSSEVASSVVPTSDAVRSSVVTPSGAQSSNILPSIVESSVADSSDALSSPVHLPIAASSVIPSSVALSSIVHSSYVAPSVAPLPEEAVPSAVVPPCVLASSVVQSPDVVSSVVNSSRVSPSSIVLSVVASSVVHSPDAALSGVPPSSASPSATLPSSVSSIRVRPQRISQAWRSPTSVRTVDATMMPPKQNSSSFASSAAAAATAELSHSDRRRAAMSSRRSCVASLTRRRSIPRCCNNGLKDVEKMKRKMARSRERRATVVLGIVMASFIGCWLPFFSLYPITLLVGLQLPNKLFAVIFWLGYCNSALNPIIYTIFNRDFRLAFQRILFSRRTKRF